MSNWNTAIIEEFRANDGRVSGAFEGRRLVLLHTTGARSGKERINPLACHEEDGRIFVFASKGGSDTNPAWYHNLKANPEVSYEIGSETRPAVAREVTGAERDAVYARHAAEWPAFADYEHRTDRVIPVIELT